MRTEIDEGGGAGPSRTANRRGEKPDSHPAMIDFSNERKPRARRGRNRGRAREGVEARNGRGRGPERAGGAGGKWGI